MPEHRLPEHSMSQGSVPPSGAPANLSSTAVMTAAGVQARTSPGGRLFRFRAFLGITFAAFLILCPWGRIPASLALWITGAALVLSGVALRLWAILQIGGAARKTSRLKAVELISWGPFAMVRNPIYIANLTVFAGFTVLSGLLWALPAVVFGLWAWYDTVVRLEEEFLSRSFPEAYDAYRRETRRWLPRLRRRGRPPGRPRYPFLRALRRERGHLLVVALGVAAVFGARHVGPWLHKVFAAAPLAEKLIDAVAR
jgi:protein-S-isoprenylcysteine O-methyltransferase Ste14